MAKNWVLEEFFDLSLGDKRLENRARRVLNQLSRNATESVPSSCGGAAETKAAYRLFDNVHVTPEKIRFPHVEATLSRMREHRVVLIPQDTTTLNFSTQTQRKDAGPTTQESSKGMYLHCALAVTPEKICLGAVSVDQWCREKLQKFMTPFCKRGESITLPKLLKIGG